MDEIFNIEGIIDLEWAQTTSAEHAFSSPCMMWLVGEFYDGNNNLTAEEERFAEILDAKGYNDLSEHVIRSRKIQRLLFDVGSEKSFHSYKVSVDLFKGLRKAFGAGDETWDHWRAAALGMERQRGASCCC